MSKSENMENQIYNLRLFSEVKDIFLWIPNLGNSIFI